jgi:Protein affecting phage T7 exclusion by the F plasmid
MSRIHKIHRVGLTGSGFKYIPVIILIYLIAEISLLIWIGRHFGLLNTFLLLIVSAVLGFWMVMKQGLSILREIRNELSEHRIPGQSLLDGLCLILGGILLVVPGFISDAAGLLLLIPAIRRILQQWLIKWFQDWFRRGIHTFYYFRR